MSRVQDWIRNVKDSLMAVVEGRYRGCWIYLIQGSPSTIKLGVTVREPEVRLKEIRQTHPSAELIKAWRGFKSWEKIAFRWVLGHPRIIPLNPEWYGNIWDIQAVTRHMDKLFQLLPDPARVLIRKEDFPPEHPFPEAGYVQNEDGSYSLRKPHHYEAQMEDELQGRSIAQLLKDGDEEKAE